MTLEELRRDRPDPTNYFMHTAGDLPKHVIHSERGAARLHSLLERYRAGELGTYVVVSPLLIRDRKEHLLMVKHHIGTLNQRELALRIA